ncbi:hypothetical protein Ancab_011085 [Ancistrocladus abbreviatus]
MAEDQAIPNSFVQSVVVGSKNYNIPTATVVQKKKRNLPGNPDPEAEVISLSPKTLLATNRFLCEICGKGFQRDQNLQLHRRGHNLPWKLKQRGTKEPKKRVYVCPEKSCVHHHPSRALGDLTGIKKHFCRKHGEKKWKCEKCSKHYAVQSDWKAHSKTCGTREYKCDCGTIFSRRDSFITHRAFCDALAEETARVNADSHLNISDTIATANNMNYHVMGASLVPGMPTQHFSSIFKPLTAKDEQAVLHQNQQLPFPLWLGQVASPNHPQTLQNNNNNIQEINPLGSINSIYASNSIVLSSSSQSTTDCQLNWVSACKISPSNEELDPSTLIPLSGNVPSLYSFQHQPPHQQAAPVHMSATALLQKAAQMGLTSSDPFLLGNMGMKGNISLTEVEDGNKHSGTFGSSSTTSTNLGHLESSVNDVNHHRMQMNPIAAKRQKLLQSEDSVEGEHTRDFLGIGTQPSICQPSLINGWI